MAKNSPKIYKLSALLTLAIIISGLLNICLFTFQAKAMPLQPLKIDFTYDSGGDCVAQAIPEPILTINRPAAPMPECCLAQNRYYKAVINAANDKPAPVYANPIFLSAKDLCPENNFTHYTSRFTYPPPASPALASIIIRE